MVVEVAALDDFRANGADEVRFLFTANASMSPRPVEKIASGGEISRVMLALKTLSARSAGQPTVIFDEIDAGVSGRVADAMGDIIAELAGHCQVLNITHLPQIAAKRGEHFLVYKEGGATHIRALSADERVAEIAKMLSGSTVTAAAMKQAEELLKSE
jgi:DNA repair protein RecN (Recombination protein N)